MTFILRFLLLVILLLTGCLPQPEATSIPVEPAQQTHTETPGPADAVPTLDLPPSPLPTSTSSPVPPTPTAEETITPTEVLAETFPLAIPILPPGRTIIDPTYRFGTTQNGERELHNGVEFLNSQGTPVNAAANGVVIFSGDDFNGSPYSPPGWYAFYGLFVVIEHSFPGHDVPIYTLYAHLSETAVSTGQPIKRGEIVGLVGFTGAAVGSHLHFEVRYGGFTYADSRNPEYWMKPEIDHGALTGSIKDAAGLPLPIIDLQLIPQGEAGQPLYFTTYQDSALHFQLPASENFALGNLPAGSYELSFIAYKLEKHIIEIKPGEITHIEIVIGANQ